MSILTFLQKLTFQRGGDVLLVKGHDSKNRTFYAYLKVTEKDIQKVTIAQQKGLLINLLEHSKEILAYGWDEPSEEITQQFNAV